MWNGRSKYGFIGAILISRTDWIKLHFFVAPALARAVLARKVGLLVVGISLAQNDGPYKWANVPFYIHLHANFTVLKGHFKF